MYLVMGFFHFTSLSIFWNDDQAKLNHIIWVKQNEENQTGGSFEENKSSWCHWKPTDCNKASNLPWGKMITYKRQSTRRDYSNNLQRPDISEAKHEHSECTKKVTRSRNWSQIFITSKYRAKSQACATPQVHKSKCSVKVRFTYSNKNCLMNSAHQAITQVLRFQNLICKIQ